MAQRGREHSAPGHCATPKHHVAATTYSPKETRRRRGVKVVEIPILAWLGSQGGPNPSAPRPHSLRDSRREGMHVQDTAQMLPVSPGTHTQSTGGCSSRGTGSGRAGRAEGCGRRLPTVHGLGSRGERPGCSLPSSKRSIPLPRWDKHPLPALNQLQRGWGGGQGGEKKNLWKEKLISCDRRKR